MALAEKKGQQSDETESNDNSNAEEPRFHEHKNEQSQVSTSAAFHIAASGASYLHRQRTNLLPLRSLKKEVDDRTSNVDESDDNLASLMATTDSVTAVVAAEEEVKQAVADDLSSISSSPCEWYICDDKKTATRFFVIQVRLILSTLLSFEETTLIPHFCSNYCFRVQLKQSRSNLA